MNKPITANCDCTMGFSTSSGHASWCEAMQGSWESRAKAAEADFKDMTDFRDHWRKRTETAEQEIENAEHDIDQYMEINLSLLNEDIPTLEAKLETAEAKLAIAEKYSDILFKYLDRLNDPVPNDPLTLIIDEMTNDVQKAILEGRQP